jgi:hypothetical protein
MLDELSELEVTGLVAPGPEHRREPAPEIREELAKRRGWWSIPSPDYW